MNQQLIPPRAFIRNCRANRRKLQIADSLGEKLTGGQLLLRTLILRRLLLREVLTDEDRYVGILIPPSAGGIIVNAAMPLCGRIGVNLNYTLSKAEMDHCIATCGIKRVLTTRRVMDKLDVQIDVEVVYLDDLRDKLTSRDKATGAAQAFLTPIGILERRLGLNNLGPDDVLTVIFTSGSTNLPKGVELTNRNVGSNVEAIRQAVQLSGKDVVLGTLPLFHSFGYTITMWTVLALPPTGVYHFSPLDAKIVGRLCREYQGTFLLSTPTFLRSYLKRCTPEDFASLEVVFAGAEKLPTELCDAFEKKFGIRPLEGYGCTELSPLVSANLPAQRVGAGEVSVKEGSVGRPVPGVKAKVVHPETGEELDVGSEGMLLIGGPGVMKGYLHQPEKTAEVLRDGWYVTGDVARLDEEGFITITGRLSRFSKIGGEMVPHLKVEEEIQRLVGQDSEEINLAVTAVPCPRKGERLIVMHRKLDKTPDEICRGLSERGLPNIFIPGRDSFCEVQDIPVLGTGKLDLKGLKELALKKYSAESAK